MTKAELIKRFEENRDKAQRLCVASQGVVAAVHREEAGIWAKAINLAMLLDEPKSEEPPAKKSRKIEIYQDGSLWRSEVWEECEPGTWKKAWDLKGVAFTPVAAMNAAMNALMGPP